MEYMITHIDHVAMERVKNEILGTKDDKGSSNSTTQ